MARGQRDQATGDQFSSPAWQAVRLQPGIQPCRQKCRQQRGSGAVHRATSMQPRRRFSSAFSRLLDSRLIGSSGQLVAEQKCRESSLCTRRSAPVMVEPALLGATCGAGDRHDPHWLNVKPRSAVRRTRSASRVRRGASNGLRSSAGSWEALEDDVFGFESVMGRRGSRLRV